MDPPHPHKILENVEKKFEVFCKFGKFFVRLQQIFSKFSILPQGTQQIRSFPFGVYKYYIPLNGRFADLLITVP